MCDVFFFHDAATTEIYAYGHILSLHDALPFCLRRRRPARIARDRRGRRRLHLDRRADQARARDRPVDEAGAATGKVRAPRATAARKAHLPPAEGKQPFSRLRKESSPSPACGRKAALLPPAAGEQPYPRM